MSAEKVSLDFSLESADSVVQCGFKKVHCIFLLNEMYLFSFQNNSWFFFCLQWECDKCDKVFSKISHLIEHKTTHKVLVEKFLCPIPNCDQCCSQIRNLRVHFKRSHKDDTLDESDVRKVYIDRLNGLNPHQLKKSNAKPSTDFGFVENTPMEIEPKSDMISELSIKVMPEAVSSELLKTLIAARTRPYGEQNLKHFTKNSPIPQVTASTGSRARSQTSNYLKYNLMKMECRRNLFAAR